MGRWYLNRNFLEPFIRLLNGKWIEGNETRFSKRDLETMAEVIDANNEPNEPKYVLIAVSGNFNTDDPESFIAKRGLALAYKIRMKNNLKKGIASFNSIILPSVEKMKKESKKKYVIIYDEPINPNDFIIHKNDKKEDKINKDLNAFDFDTFGLTDLIQSRIHKIMASYQ